MTHTLHEDIEFISLCCKRFQFFHSSKAVFHVWRAYLQVNHYSYTKSLFSPSSQYTSRWTRFLWYVLPMTMTLTSVWSSFIPSANTFSSLLKATSFWSFNIVPLYTVPNRGVHNAVQCGFRPFLALYFTMQFSQNHNCNAPYFCSHMCSVVQCGLEFSQNHNRTASHFCGYICSAVYKMWFEWFEVGIFFKFWVFLTQPKTNFSLFEPSFKLLT